ncbi:hypothetical protein [Bradyrhizobium sp. 191]|uniref:hypothetical protein n=1 Tax=Bradyrhizobium sp. 191 TaxID=2782659 RepID=UPI0032092CC5
MPISGAWTRHSSSAFQPLGRSSQPGPTGCTRSKYDGYRLRLEREGERVRLITKGGYDWTKRYPWIVVAALKNREL